MRAKIKILFCKLGQNKIYISVLLSYFLLLIHKLTRKYEKEFLKCVISFYGSEKLKNSNFIKKITKDCYFSMIYYKIDIKDYFLYNFYELTDSERKEYIGDTEKDEFLTNIGNKETRMVLNDKYKCYLKFQKYYKREMLNQFKCFSLFLS